MELRQPGPRRFIDLSDVPHSYTGAAGEVATVNPGETGLEFASGGGGGGTPSAPDTSVQFNNAGSFGGSANFTWDNVNEWIQLINDTDGTRTTTISGLELVSYNGYTVRTSNSATPDTGGSALTFQSGNGMGTGSGGQYQFSGGDGGDTGDGAQMTFSAGGGGATSGAGGSISLTAGSAQGGDSNGGQIEIIGGDGVGGGNAGGITLRGGRIAPYNSASIEIFGSELDDGPGTIAINLGNDGNATAGGELRLHDGLSGFAAVLNMSLLADENKTFYFPNQTGTFVVNPPDANDSSVNIILQAGDAVSGDNNGGDISIMPGNPTGAGSNGHTVITKTGFNNDVWIQRTDGVTLKIKAQDTKSRVTFPSGDLYFDSDDSGTNVAIMYGGGNVQVTNLGGGGTQFVTASNTGVLGVTTAIPRITDTKSLTAQTADIADTAFTINGTGLYRIGFYLLDTTADLTAGAVTLNIKFTDNAAARTISSSPVVLTATSGFAQGDIIARLNSGSITYGVTHSGIFGTSAYALYLSIEKLI